MNQEKGKCVRYSQNTQLHLSKSKLTLDVGEVVGVPTVIDVDVVSLPEVVVLVVPAVVVEVCFNKQVGFSFDQMFM